jgi:hypothetical protein
VYDLVHWARTQVVELAKALNFGLAAGLASAVRNKRQQRNMRGAYVVNDELVG